jgi:transcriptional regulator with GAF, ATPase, and Fis domain
MSSLTDKVQEIEREEILNALKECNWVMSRAARILGITERMIGYKVRKYKIRKEADNSIQQVADSRQ